VAVIKTAAGFRFMPTDDGPFSQGVVAEPGYRIVRVHAPHFTPLEEGFRLVERTLEAAGRPTTSICAMELRIPKPLTQGDFDDFNRPYVAQHERWGLRVDGHMAPARTNVSPEVEPPSVPCLRAFCHTVEGDWPRNTFVISGAPEPPGTHGGPAAYWNAIAKTLDERMAALGVAWAEVTDAQIYATRADYEMFAESALSRFQELVRPGLRWFFSRPPISFLNLEIDVRGLAMESWV
jgi:hypothetical protein